MKQRKPLSPRALWILLGIVLPLSACGGDVNEGSASLNGSAGGTPESNGVAGSTSSDGPSGGTTSTSGTTATAGGTAACLGGLAPGMGGFAGGACEATRCGSQDSLSYRTCNWVWSVAELGVFAAVDGCLRAASDLCSEAMPARIAECTDPIFAQACTAPGVMVGDVAANCSDVTAACPAVREQDCAPLMNMLKATRRQQAYECFFAETSVTEDCAVAFHACIGRPE